MAIMTSRQAAELDHAFERNGWTAEDVKKVSGGELLASLLLVVRERAEVVAKFILTFFRIVRIAAQPAITTSEVYFKEARVVWMGDNFKAQFLSLEVFPVEETELAVSKLMEASIDASILAELGDKAEISVSQFREFLFQNYGSSEWFIFYLKGKNGKIWTVCAFWYGGGWRVYADSVAPPAWWDAGRQVLSRKAT